MTFAEYSDTHSATPAGVEIFGWDENPGVTRFSRHPWLLSIVPAGQRVVTIFCDPGKIQESGNKPTLGRTAFTGAPLYGQEAGKAKRGKGDWTDNKAYSIPFYSVLWNDSLGIASFFKCRASHRILDDRAALQDLNV